MYQITAGGIDAHHNASFFMSRPNGLKDHVLLFVKVKALFTIADDSFCVSPGSALFIRQNTPYEYRSAKGDYCDDWLHFSGGDWANADFSGVPFHQPLLQPNPAVFTLYIRQLLWESSYTPEPYRQENVDMLFRVLLNTARLSMERNISMEKKNSMERSNSMEKNRNAQPYHPCHAKLRELRLTILAQPYKNYSPARLAAALGISTSSFQHLYTQLFGISFGADLIGMRIAYAKDLIQNTNLTMERIAEMCGYNSEVHFYRQFKKYVGMTPAACRKSKDLL